MVTRRDYSAEAVGELLTFNDPEMRLPAIDRLEGFRPGGPSVYRRVLVPVQVDGAVCPAWLFVGMNSTLIRATFTRRFIWT